VGKMRFTRCTECLHFLYCEFPKIAFHKAFSVPCDMFKEVCDVGQDEIFEDVSDGCVVAGGGDAHKEKCSE
jgi:hypothetical protein